MAWQAEASGDFWKDLRQTLPEAKKACHQLFFGLLTEETLTAHMPIY